MTRVAALSVLLFVSTPALCQAPRVDLAGDAPTLLFSLLEDSVRVDPMLSLEAGRALLAHRRLADATQDRKRAVLGMGSAWLVLGDVDRALECAQVILDEPELETVGAASKSLVARAHALVIRANLYRGSFADALLLARRAVDAVGLDEPELHAAHAAALYRNRHFDEAASLYRGLLRDDPLQIEALMRLGGGLQDPRPAPVDAALRDAIFARKRGDAGSARVGLTRVLSHYTEHPTALRILGELELADERRGNPLVASGYFDDLFASLDPGRVEPWMRRFVRGYDDIDEERRQMVRVSLRPFGNDLRRVLEKGGRHDLLGAAERTTDAIDRAFLRGQRTFDGRVWDDVRGIGGLCAATGVEALDEAREGGFQTLVHEFAHQLHFHVLGPEEQSEIERLYRSSKRNRSTLDYYAASNAGEYFAQGFEAWYSLCKAPGQPITHGHTRFELERKDPELAKFIARVARFDPLRRVLDGASKDREGTRAFVQRLFDGAIEAVRPGDAKALLTLIERQSDTRPSREALRLETLCKRLHWCGEAAREVRAARRDG
ncbi:MAG: hypothetical protein H6832_06705 [Planctomycetes bacterium]|nr:hypothetical protein [Planctomycetota bacterium]MCB9918077.1 hypothetical protein [Planctomycetota bacterium]